MCNLRGRRPGLNPTFHGVFDFKLDRVGKGMGD